MPDLGDLQIQCDLYLNSVEMVWSFGKSLDTLRSGLGSGHKTYWDVGFQERRTLPGEWVALSIPVGLSPWTGQLNFSSGFLLPAEQLGPVCLLRGALSCLDIVTAIYRISSAAAETEPVWLRIVCPSLGF